MLIVRFLCALLCAGLFSLPLRAQGGAAGSAGFPGVPWGVSTDSVIRLLGEPAERSTAPPGLDNLVFAQMEDGLIWGRYILVHPSMGTVMAGYGASLQGEAECHAAALAVVDRVVRAYPRLVWEAGDRPRPDAVCAPGAQDEFAEDPESGTRVSVGVNDDRTLVGAQAISAAGWTWVGSLNPRP